MRTPPPVQQRRTPVTKPPSTGSGWIALLCSVTLIGLTTLGSGEAAAPPATAQCWRCGSFWLTDLLANLVLFVPFGIALARLRVRFLIIGLAGLALSACVELWQLFAVTGRDATLADIAANTAGSLLGAALAAQLANWVFPSPARARRLSMLASALVAGGASALSPLLTPTRAPGPLFLQFLPASAEPIVTLGRVNGVVFNGTPRVSVGRMSDEDAIRSELLAQRTHLEAVIATAPPAPAAMPLVRVTPRILAAVAEIRIEPHGVLAATGLRAEDLGLRGLQLFVEWPAGAADGPVRMAVSRQQDVLSLRASSSRAVSERTVRLSALELWVPFLPFRTVASGTPLPMSMALAFAVPLLLGWWSGRSVTARHLYLAAAALLVAGVGPVLTVGLAPPPPWSWGLALAGLATGWGYARVRVRRDVAALTSSDG